MNEIRLLLISAAILICTPVAAQQNQTEMTHDDHATIESPTANEATGDGVVNSVDPDKNSVNLTHEPMPDLGWPEMTMDLPVTRKVDLTNVKAGDQVDFKIKLGRDKKYRVIEMQPRE